MLGLQQCPLLESHISQAFSTRQWEGYSFGTKSNVETGDRTGNILQRMRLSLTSFNLLAPVYFRIDSNGILESSVLHAWTNRSRALARYLRHLDSDVICLQELWIGTSEGLNGLVVS